MKKLFIVCFLILPIAIGIATKKDKSNFSDKISKEDKHRYEDFKDNAKQVYKILDRYGMDPDKDYGEHGYFDGKLVEVESELPNGDYFECDYEISYNPYNKVSVTLRVDVDMIDLDGNIIEFKFGDSMLGDLREIILGDRNPNVDVDSIIKDLVKKGKNSDQVSLGSSEPVKEEVWFNEHNSLAYRIVIK